MTDTSKTNQELIEENSLLKQKIRILDQLRSDLKRVGENEVSQERYFDLYDLAPAGYCTLNEQGLILESNLTATTMLGVSRDALVNQPITRFILPNDQDIYYRHRRQLFETGSPQACSLQMVKQDGTTFWAHLAAGASQDAKGAPVCRVVISDVTERKRVEEELKVSKDFIALVLDNLRDLIIVIDPVNYTILEANKTFINSCGLDKDAILGKRCYELTHNRSTPCSPPDDICPLIDTLKTGKPSAVDHIHYDSAGNKLYVEVSTIPIISNGGAIQRVIHLSRNITERRRAEELLAENQLKLTEANQMLQLVIDTIPVRIFWKDLNLTYLGCNSLFARDAGRQLPTDLIGKNDYCMGWKEQADLYRQDDQEIIATGRPKINYEEPQTSPEAKQIWLRTSKVPLRDVDGFIIGVLGTYEEITERKQAEEQLQQTIESLRKAVGATIQVMVSAVEIRDPYTAGHQIRSADLARAIATEMGLSQEKIEGIRMAGSIHDIGKISIPAEILSKPTKLTDIEFSLIKEHARIGFEMLKDVESPWPLAEIVCQHHERMDGSGYPRKLKGEDICIEARILTVADVVEAMASHRPYRPGLGIDAALAEIEKNRGIFYDCDVADACLRLFREKGFQLEGA